MSTDGTTIVLNQLPEAVRAQAGQLGITDGDCLFTAYSDLTLTAQPKDVWLIVTPDIAVAIEANGSDDEAVVGPFNLSKVKRIRVRQAVGSAYLQFLMNDIYVDVIRYSNALREQFGRVCIQLENKRKGEPVEAESMQRPSEQICQVCGLPRPSRGVPCPRCSARKGVFMRSAGLMKPYHGSILLLLALMVTGVGIALVPPQLQRILVDDVLQSHRRGREWLMWILLGLLSVGVTRCVLNIFIGRVSAYVGTRITRELRERLHRKFLTLGIDYYDRHSAGQLMSRVLHDVEFFQGFVRQVSQGFLLNCILVLAIGVVLFTMNWELAFLVMLPVPVVVVGTLLFYKWIYPLYYRRSDSRAKMAKLLTGFLSGIRLVKAFGQEKREGDRFSTSATYIQDTQRSVQMSVVTFNPVMALIFNLGALIIWYAGGHLVLSQPHNFTLGKLLAFATYLSMFYVPITAMTVFSEWVTSFLSAAQRVFEVLDAIPSLKPPEKAVPLPKMRGAVEFRNVTFGYDPYNPILKNVSLRIEPGQFVGIVGKSGSGKTTLVNMICRFYDPQRGKVLIDDVNLKQIDQEDLHRQVGLVLQEPFLFRASIAQNIAYGLPKASATKIIEAARAANAHNFIARRPLAYDTRLGERGAGLSGGERQRISIARALLGNPRILILDEATSSVDTESEQAIQKSLENLGEERTIIAIAHRLSTLKNADIIFVVDDGAIAESGTHTQLMRQEGTYYKLVKIQTELASLDLEDHE